MKYIKVLLVILIVFVLVGCTKKEEDPQVRICNNLKQSIENYKTDKLTFEEFSIIAENNYDALCRDQEIEKQGLCLTLNGIIQKQNTTYELKDCEQYKEGTFKDLCISTNKVTQQLINNRERTESALITNLDYECQKIYEGQE